MHYTVTLDMISTKIHVHVLLLIMCYKYTKITQVKYAELFFYSVQPYETKNEARDISFVVTE